MHFPESHLWQTIIQLTDISSADVDIIDFLGTLAQRTIGLLGVTAGGILLTDHAGSSDLVAATTEQTRVLALSQLQHNEGPCLDACRGGRQVHCPDLATDSRWPIFARAALAAGFVAVHALPMRSTNLTIGSVGLFSTQSRELSAETAELGQTLADVAAIGIVNRRVVRRHEVLAEQLHTALKSRVVIEQAKGVLAERLHMTVDDAFTVLRGYVRGHNLTLADVARLVIDAAPATAPPTAPMPRQRLPRSPDAA
jgi:transcriptional regulator with GAF, ATPase, and Fis domain